VPSRTLALPVVGSPLDTSRVHTTSMLTHKQDKAVACCIFGGLIRRWIALIMSRPPPTESRKMNGAFSGVGVVGRLGGGGGGGRRGCRRRCSRTPSRPRYLIARCAADLRSDVCALRTNVTPKRLPWEEERGFAAAAGSLQHGDPWFQSGPDSEALGLPELRRRCSGGAGRGVAGRGGAVWAGRMLSAICG
jgi:hypothetical protein